MSKDGAHDNDDDEEDSVAAGDPSVFSDTHRAEAFSDAVFSIVITLLVLDLKPPRTEPGKLLRGLLEQWPTYLAYVTSYLYIAVVWLNHKHAFVRIRRMRRGLHWANLLILFTTALLPFPTAVNAEAVREGNPADQRTAVGLYALVGALLCASWVVFFRYLRRHPDMLEKGVPAGFFRAETVRAWIGLVLYVVAGVLGIVVAPWVALVVFLALPVFYGLTSHGMHELAVVLRRRQRA